MSKDKKLKIGLVSLHSFSNPGGVKNHILALREEFKKRGHFVKIIVPRRFPNEKYDKDIRLLGTSFPFPFNGSQSDLTFCFNTRSIDKFLKKEDFDILHFHNFGPHSWQILEKSRVKINVLTFHSYIDPGVSRFFKNFPFIFDFFKKIVNKKISGIIGTAPFNLNIFEDFRKPKIFIPNGIDLERFNPAVPKIKKYSDGKINLLFLGRIEERKGLIYLLKAYEILKKRYKNIRLIVAGEGNLKKECQNWVKEQKLKDVIFEGKIEETKTHFYFATCDIFVAPSIYGESFGIVLLEAMASGKPIVGFAIRAYKEVLKGMGREFLVKPKDWQELAQKIEILLKDEERRKEMGEWGKIEAKKYSWSIITERVLDFYQELLK